MDTLVQLLANGAMFGALLALVAVGLALVFGVMRVVNFLHAEFITLGGYVTYFVVTRFGLHPVAGLVVSVIGGMLLGTLVQRVFIDRVQSRPPVDVLLLTYGLSITGLGLVTYFFTGNFRSYPAPVGGTVQVAGATLSWLNIAVATLCAVLLGAVTAFLRYTRTGFAIRAAAQHRSAAAACGVDLRRVDLITYGLGAALGAGAGAVLSAAFTTTPLLGHNWMLDGFVVVVLGGLGSVAGAVVAALGIGMTEAVAGFVLGDSWAQMLVFVVLFVVLLARPHGFLGSEEA